MLRCGAVRQRERPWREKDLGGRAPLKEAGPPSKPPTPGTFPRHRPPVLHTVSENAVRMGACAGEFLLGLGGQLAICNERQSGRRFAYTPILSKTGQPIALSGFFVRQIAFPGDLPLSFCFTSPERGVPRPTPAQRSTFLASSPHRRATAGEVLGGGRFGGRAPLSRGAFPPRSPLKRRKSL